MNSPSGLQFTARIGTLPDATFAVVEFEGTEALSELSDLTLTLASPAPEIPAAEVLDAELRIFQDGELLRRFDGVVAEFSRGDTGHRVSHTGTQPQALEEDGGTGG